MTRVKGTPRTSERRTTTYGMVWYGMVNVDLYSAIITKSLMR